MEYIAKWFVRAGNEVFGPGEPIRAKLAKEEARRLLELDAIRPAAKEAFAYDAEFENEAADDATDSDGVDADDVISPEIDADDGIITPPAEEAPAAEEKTRRRGGGKK